MSASEACQPALIASLRERFQAAEARGDADLKLALFREAVALGIQPAAFQGPSNQQEQPQR